MQKYSRTNNISLFVTILQAIGWGGLRAKLVLWRYEGLSRH